MVRSFLSAVFAMSLLVGSLAFEAGAQGTVAPKPATSSQAGSESGYPPCSSTVHDRCIEVNKRLNQAYPSCAEVRSPSQKAACAETAYKDKRS
jgi:hypothetical protein